MGLPTKRWPVFQTFDQRTRANLACEEVTDGAGVPRAVGPAAWAVGCRGLGVVGRHADHLLTMKTAPVWHWSDKAQCVMPWVVSVTVGVPAGRFRTVDFGGLGPESIPDSQQEDGHENADSGRRSVGRVAARDDNAIQRSLRRLFLLVPISDHIIIMICTV